VASFDAAAITSPTVPAFRSFTISGLNSASVDCHPFAIKLA